MNDERPGRNGGLYVPRGVRNRRRATEVVVALVERAQGFGIRDDDLAALGLDQPLALVLRQRERHGLARGADQVRELLMRDLERDERAARIVDAVLAAELDEQLAELARHVAKHERLD